MKAAFGSILILILVAMGSTTERPEIVIKADQLSPEYRSIFGMPRGTHDIQFEFVSEDTVAIRYFDGWDTAVLAVQEQRPENHFHVLIDVFSIHKAERIAHLNLDTTTVLSAMVPFDGSLLIAHGQTITRTGSSNQIEQEVAANALCEGQTTTMVTGCRDRNPTRHPRHRRFAAQH